MRSTLLTRTVQGVLAAGLVTHAVTVGIPSAAALTRNDAASACLASYQADLLTAHSATDRANADRKYALCMSSITNVVASSDAKTQVSPPTPKPEVHPADVPSPGLSQPSSPSGSGIG